MKGSKNFWDTRTFPPQIFMLGLMCLMSMLYCSTADAEKKTLNPYTYEAKNPTPKRITSYWVQLKKAADNCYSGFDLDVRFEAGARQSEEVDYDTETYGKFIFSVPFFSKKDRMATTEEKLSFLEKGVDLIREIEETSALIKQKQVYVEVLQKMGKTKGLNALETAMKMREEIIVLENRRNAAIRKFEGYVKCGERLY